MIGSTFSIKHLTNPENKDFIKSISIYNNNTPIDIKTNSNEIVYWTQNSNDKFKIFSFALLLNDKIVGYAMTSFIYSQKMLIYDYIALDNNSNNTLFLAYFNLIKTYFINQKFDINYYVVEISNKNKGREKDKETKLFLKFLCIENFSRIDIQYDSLPLGLNNSESAFKAYLYIKSINDRKTITKERFLDLISALYKDYYLSWYEPFFNEKQLESYLCIINDSLSKIYNLVKDKERINIIQTQCNNSLEKREETLDLQTKGVKSTFLIIITALIALVLPIIIVLVYNLILEKLNIEITSVSSLLGGLGGAIISGIITIIIFIAQKKNHNL